MPCLLRTGLWLLVATAAALPARADDLASRVLVVFNKYSKESQQVARHYMDVRGIPSANACPIKPVGLKDGKASLPIVYVAWGDEFDSQVRKPIRKCLERVGKQRILYIVMAYQTPYKIGSEPAGLGVSIDQHLADIWDEVGAAGLQQRAVNPYFAPSRNKAGRYVRFESLADYRARGYTKLLYSVWRLDAPSAALAKGLVDKAMAAEKAGLSGLACFDRRGGGKDMVAENIGEDGYMLGDWEIFRAAQAARAVGFQVLEDDREAEIGTPPAPARCDNTALYAGWYSLNHYNDAFSWAPGAIGFHLDSGSAMDPRGGNNWSANAVAKGITATAGAVTEPYLQGLPRPGGIFRNLFEGANLGDAVLRNTLWIKWNTINIGDPLYRPFPAGKPPFNRKKGD